MAGSCRRAQWTQGPLPQPSTETQSCSPGSRLSGSYRICTRRPGMAQLPWSMQPARAHGSLLRAPVVRFTDVYSVRSAVCDKSWCVLFHWQPKDAAAKVYAASALGGAPPLQGCNCIKLALCSLFFARELQHYWIHWQPTALSVAGFARLHQNCASTSCLNSKYLSSTMLLIQGRVLWARCAGLHSTKQGEALPNGSQDHPEWVSTTSSCSCMQA